MAHVCNRRRYAPLPQPTSSTRALEFGRSSAASRTHATRSNGGCCSSQRRCRARRFASVAYCVGGFNDTTPSWSMERIQRIEGGQLSRPADWGYSKQALFYDHLMSLEWEQTIIDALDPRGLGLWWREALGWV